MIGVSRYTSGSSIRMFWLGFVVGKYEKTPQSDNGIRNPVSGNMIAWSSSLGSCTCIFGTSWTVTPASLNMNGGSRLFVIEGTCSAFCTTRMYVSPKLGQSYCIAASTSGMHIDL